MAEPVAEDPGKQRRAQVGIPVVPVFDGYRAYAVFGVVFLHILLFSGVLPLVGSGWMLALVHGTLGQSIDVLFIVSGFVVFLPTVARAGDFGSVKAYGIRRAARLVPAYWAILAIVLVLLATVPTDFALPYPTVANVGVHLAFLQAPVGMAQTLYMGFGVDGAVWTLSLEVGFYLLLPLVASRYFRRPFLGLAIAAAVTIGWHEAIIHFSGITSALGLHPSLATSVRLMGGALTQLPFFAFSFGLGMTAAWAYVRLRETRTPAQLTRGALVGGAAGLIALILFAYLVGRASTSPGMVANSERGRLSPILALGYSASITTLMLAIAVAGPRWQRPFSYPRVRQLGDISYGVYLVHTVILTYALEALPSLRSATKQIGPFSLGDGSLRTVAVLTAVVIPGSIMYGYVSARVLERPIRRWAQLFAHRDSALRSAPAVGLTQDGGS